MVAVSPNTPDHSLSMAEKNRLDFAVLSDAGNRVARRYGLVYRVPDKLRQIYLNAAHIDLAEFNGDDSWELPVPGTFVLSKDGRVRLRFAEIDHTRRLEPEDILSCLPGLH